MSERLYQSDNSSRRRGQAERNAPDPGKVSRSSMLDAPSKGRFEEMLEATDVDDRWLADGDKFETFDGVAFLHGISPGDVEQGALGDCWLIGGLQALARSKPELIRNMITPAGPGLWRVTFHFPTLAGTFEPHTVTVDSTVPVKRRGVPQYAGTGYDRDGHRRELWVLLIEKAYAKTQGGYKKAVGLDSGTRGYGAMEMVTGKRNGRIDHRSEPDVLLKELDVAHRVEGRAVTLGTIARNHPNAPIAERYTPEINRLHTYALDNVDIQARTVNLLNPHGENHLDSLSIDIVRQVVDQILTSGQ